MEEGQDSSDSEDDVDDVVSTGSSPGREDFNSKNKKKRKIPLSATSSGNMNHIVADIGSPSSSLGGMRNVNGKGRLTGWRVPSAISRNEGGYSRRKTRRSVSSEPQTPPSSTPLVPAVESPAEDDEDHADKTQLDRNEVKEPSSPIPSAPFSFSCPPTLAVPLTSTGRPDQSPQSVHARQVSAPPTAPLPVPPAVSQGQENILSKQGATSAQQSHSRPQHTQSIPQPQHPQTTQQAHGQPQTTQQSQAIQQPQQHQQTHPQPQQQQQQRLPQNVKHPNSEKARRVAQLTKLRERYRTGPKPDTVPLRTLVSNVG